MALFCDGNLLPERMEWDHVGGNLMRESLKDYIERKQKKEMGWKAYGENILKKFKDEMQAIYTKHKTRRD